jgi:hypothetical protein
MQERKTLRSHANMVTRPALSSCRRWRSHQSESLKEKAVGQQSGPGSSEVITDPKSDRGTSLGLIRGSDLVRQTLVNKSEPRIGKKTFNAVSTDQ